MAFTKIESTDLIDKGVIGLPDTPGLSTAAMQSKLEETARSVIIPKHNELIDELQAVDSATSLGANPPTGRTVLNPTVQGGLNKLSEDLKVVEDGMAEAIAQTHTHSNKTYIDKISEDGSGNPLYDGNPIGAGAAWGDITGTLSAQTDLNTALSGKSDTGHTHTKSDITDFPSLATVATSGSYNDLNNKPSIPTVTDTYDGTSSDATSGKAVASAISTKSTVTYSQTYTSAGQKIGEITIDGTKTDVIAPSGGGGGGGGAVDSVNGQTGTVVLDLDDINDTSIASLADQDTLVYNGTAGTWGNEPLADVALTGSYANLTNTPTIPDGLADLTDDVAISSPSSGQILQHNGTKWANANMPSIPDGLADLTDDVNITSPSNDQVLKYDGSSSKWINGSAPASGHTMLPTPNASVDESAVVSAVKGGITEGGINDDVASLYGVGKWSNTMTKTFEIKGKAGSSTRITQSGIGTWPADPQNPTAAELETWIPIRELYGIWSSGDDVHFSLGFHLETLSVPITLGGYYIDDNCTMSDGQGGTIPCGRIVIKFGNEIPEADTHTAVISVEMTIKRTDIIEVG